MSQELSADNSKANNSTSYLQSILDRSFDAYIGFDSTGTIIQWSTAAERMFERKHKNAVGECIFDLIMLDEYRPVIERALQLHVTCGQAPIINKRMSMSVQTSSGKELPVEFTIFPIEESAEGLFGVFFHDLSTLNAEQEKLELIHKRLQLIINNVPQAVFWKNRQLQYEGCNKAFAVQAGLRNAKDIIGKTDYDMPWRTHEGDYYRLLEQKVLENGQPICHVIEPQLQADGKEAWVEINRLPIYDASGAIVGLLGTYEDITEKVQRDKERADLFAGLAHDLKTPVLAVLQGLDLILAQRLGYLSDPQSKFISMLRESHKHLLKMVHDLLHVMRYEAKASEPQFETVNISKLVRTSLSELRVLVSSKHISLKRQISNGLILSADKTGVKRLLTNLLSNAIKFTPEGGHIEVLATSEANEIVICVKNTGEGISKEVAAQMFERFWKGNERSDGAGLGLYICRKIAEVHNAKIECRSENNDGTTFTVRFPMQAKSEIPQIREISA